MDKIVGQFLVSQQLLDEADEVAREQGWDTLNDELNRVLAQPRA